MNKENLLKLGNNKDEKLLISKLVDTATVALKTNYLKCTKFLNGREQVLAKYVFNSMGVSYVFFGGYDQYERAVAVCFTDEVYLDTYIYPVKILDINVRDGYKLNHRDYLGSIMGLGIKREMIGDIIADKSGAKVFVYDEIAEYLKLQISKIGNLGASVEIYEIGDIVIPQRQYKDISFTVSSPRIDSIVSGATGVSRGDAATLISGGNVSLNWETVASHSKTAEQSQILSVKGYGRYKIDSIGGVTKKGRIFVTVKKFI
ncbi:MAG: hypothetical protein IJF30_00990 [Clostridia bacterium]|nr:hypothetical protein [Clostridia bacterium]